MAKEKSLLVVYVGAAALRQTMENGRVTRPRLGTATVVEVPRNYHARRMAHKVNVGLIDVYQPRAVGKAIELELYALPSARRQASAELDTDLLFRGAERTRTAHGGVDGPRGMFSCLVVRDEKQLRRDESSHACI